MKLWGFFVCRPDGVKPTEVLIAEGFPQASGGSRNAPHLGQSVVFCVAALDAARRADTLETAFDCSSY